MKLLVDMNLSPRWVALLANAGWQAKHWSEVGKPDASDSEILRFAASNDYVVLTHDLDFGAILAISHGKKHSVVQIRSGDTSPESVATQTVAALRK
jgi:predicted nuclease of predicted toxin-antitoxin system